MTTTPRRRPDQVQLREISTDFGPGRLHWHPAGTAAPIGALLLGHGAGGGVTAGDLVAVTAAAVAAGLDVGLFEQPYRVAGRRAPAPARQLDVAFAAALQEVGAGPVVLGGRSSGARVACRVAAGLARPPAAAPRIAGILALAFPLHPPGRPDRSRLDELLAPPVPRLVVQGERDSFGGATALQAELVQAGRPAKGVTVLPAPGADHALRKGLDVDAVVRWALARCRRRATTRASS